MDETRQFVEKMFREAQQRAKPLPWPPPEPLGVHYTEIPEADPNSDWGREHNTYRREIGRWLAEGLEGKSVLIKGEEVLGFFDTLDAAYQEGVRRFLMGPFFVKTILTREPYLRIRGLNFPLPVRLENPG